MKTTSKRSTTPARETATEQSAPNSPEARRDHRPTRASTANPKLARQQSNQPAPEPTSFADTVPDTRLSAGSVDPRAAELLRLYVTRWKTLCAEFDAFRATVDGMTICEAVLRDLNELADCYGAAGTTTYAPTHVAAVEQPQPDAPLRERFWTMPGNVRLTAKELADAIGKSTYWVYRHTSPRTGLVMLPFRKDTGGALAFVVSDVRQWIMEHERIPFPAEARRSQVRSASTGRRTAGVSR